MHSRKAVCGPTSPRPSGVSGANRPAPSVTCARGGAFSETRTGRHPTFRTTTARSAPRPGSNRAVSRTPPVTFPALGSNGFHQYAGPAASPRVLQACARPSYPAGCAARSAMQAPKAAQITKTKTKPLTLIVAIIPILSDLGRCRHTLSTALLLHRYHECRRNYALPCRNFSRGRKIETLARTERSDGPGDYHADQFCVEHWGPHALRPCHNHTN